MSRIILEMVPASKMRLEAYRNEGFGDWFIDGKGDFHVQVAGPEERHCADDSTLLAPNIMDADDAFLIALHELIELKLCLKSGVTVGAVDAFDTAFEAERRDGQHSDEAEPGDDARAPYRTQHRKACLIEFLMADFLGKPGYGSIGG